MIASQAQADNLVSQLWHNTMGLLHACLPLGISTCHSPHRPAIKQSSLYKPLLNWCVYLGPFIYKLKVWVVCYDKHFFSPLYHLNWRIFYQKVNAHRRKYLMNVPSRRNSSKLVRVQRQSKKFLGEKVCEPVRRGCCTKPWDGMSF